MALLELIAAGPHTNSLERKAQRDMRREQFDMVKKFREAQIAKSMSEIKTAQEAEYATRQIGGILAQSGNLDENMRAMLTSENHMVRSQGIKMYESQTGKAPTGIMAEWALRKEIGPEAFRELMEDKRAGQGPLVINNPEQTLSSADIDYFNEVERPKLSGINNTLRGIAQFRGLLKTGVRTGYGADIQAKIARVGEFLGFGTELAGMTPDQLSASEAAQRLTLEAASEMFAMQKGPISDREFATILASSPNILQSKGGLYRLLDLMEETARFNRDTIIAHRRWIKTNGDDAGWLEEESRMVDDFIMRKTLPEGAKLDN